MSTENAGCDSYPTSAAAFYTLHALRRFTSTGEEVLVVEWIEPGQWELPEYERVGAGDMSRRGWSYVGPLAAEAL